MRSFDLDSSEQLAKLQQRRAIVILSSILLILTVAELIYSCSRLALLPEGCKCDVNASVAQLLDDTFVAAFHFIELVIFIFFLCKARSYLRRLRYRIG